MDEGLVRRIVTDDPDDDVGIPIMHLPNVKSTDIRNVYFLACRRMTGLSGEYFRDKFNPQRLKRSGVRLGLHHNSRYMIPNLHILIPIYFVIRIFTRC